MVVAVEFGLCCATGCVCPWVPVVSEVGRREWTGQKEVKERARRVKERESETYENRTAFLSEPVSTSLPSCSLSLKLGSESPTLI